MRLVHVRGHVADAASFGANALEAMHGEERGGARLNGAQKVRLARAQARAREVTRPRDVWHHHGCRDGL